MFSTIIQPQAQQMTSLCWRRLVRYTTKDGGVVSEPKYGDAWETPPTADLGLLAEQGHLSVRALTVGPMGPLDGSVEFTSQDTNNVEKVHRLLSPLAERDVPLFRCIGLNYKTHSEFARGTCSIPRTEVASFFPTSSTVLEAGRTLPPYPSQFIKPSTSIADYGDDIPIPKCAQDPPEADYEGELCVVIGKRCRDVEPSEAMKFVAGYTIGNDVSTRKWQRDKERAGGVPQWCFSKGFDKFAPLGPCLVNVKVRLSVPAKMRMCSALTCPFPAHR